MEESQIPVSNETTEKTSEEQSSISQQTEENQSETTDAVQSENPQEVQTAPTEDKPSEEPSSDQVEPSSKLSKKTWTFKPTLEIEKMLNQVVEEQDTNKSAAANMLIEHLIGKVGEYAEKLQEAYNREPQVKEVEVKLAANEFKIRLSPDQLKLIHLICDKRMEAAKKKGVDRAETVETILVRSFFIRGRLFNLDNEFYTGLSKADLK